MVFDGSLVKTTWGTPLVTLRGDHQTQKVKCGNMEVLFSPSPLSFAFTTFRGQTIQQLSIDPETGVVSS